MNQLLAMCRHFPQRRIARGEALIDEGTAEDRMYVLREGSFEVVRSGVVVVRVDGPGSFLGEISAVLGSPSTAAVVATQDSVVHVIENASRQLRRNAELSLAVAQLMARRLVAVTDYLVDIKHQYAGRDGDLSVMDRVLGDLVSTVSPSEVALGPERADVSGH